MYIFNYLILIYGVHLAQPQRTFLDDFIAPFRVFRKIQFNVLQNLANGERNIKYLKTQEPIPESMPFPCTIEKRTTKPKSVHELKPSDIDVVGALGDSLTAGFGVTATKFLGVFLEERGKVFTIGGDANWRKYTTIPNILKEFNPNLVGFSTGNVPSIDKGSQLNVAEGAAMSRDMPYMAGELVRRIKGKKNINNNEDWKLIFIYIGHNDLCSDVCYLKNPEESLERHKSDMIETLRVLKNNLPRTLVNIIPIPHMSVLTSFDNLPPICDIAHLTSCSCLFGTQFEHTRQRTFDINSRWQQIDVELGENPEFDTDDFTVVVQPFSLNYTFPKTPNGRTDLSYLSADCFHFSQKLNAKVANDLWNSMLEPVGQKPLDGAKFLSKFNCPTPQKPFIYTRRNS